MRACVLPYDVALREPLVTSASTIDRRRGFLLELSGSCRLDAGAEGGRGSSELRGYGEAAPAWWLGESTIEETGEALSQAAEIFARAEVETHEWLELLRALDAGTPLPTAGRAPTVSAARTWAGTLSSCWHQWPASVRSAVVTAVLDLEARVRGLRVAELLASEAVATQIETSRLVGGENERALASSSAAAAEAGFQSVKLKVGAYPPERDEARLRRVRDAVGPGVAIRLDANRAWGLPAAMAALEAMAAWSPQLVEEPLRDADPVGLARLRAHASVPIALDESISTLDDLERHLGAGSIDFLVVKLARVGGPLRALSLARAAAARGVATIVTDSIETSVGQAAALHVAAALPGPAHAVGLGGAATLSADDLGASPFAAPLVALPAPGLTGAHDPRAWAGPGSRWKTPDRGFPTRS